MLTVVKAAFHDTDILARIVARRVGRLPRSACHMNIFRKSRVSDVSAWILARISVSVSWNVGFTHDVIFDHVHASALRRCWHE